MVDAAVELAEHASGIQEAMEDSGWVRPGTTILTGEGREIAKLLVEAFTFDQANAIINSWMRFHDGPETKQVIWDAVYELPEPLGDDRQVAVVLMLLFVPDLLYTVLRGKTSLRLSR